MRLINIATLALEEKFGDDIPRYAILSHTWRDEEVTFQDWQGSDHGAKKKGFQKIQGACLMAKKYGLEYLWVDTNCINKDSSSELSEAINSMFTWYQRSAICLVYLDDFQFESNISLVNFGTSRWFKRGWTLQELLAPKNVRFFDTSWTEFGTKVSLIHHIGLATSIHMQYLIHPDSVWNASVARRMSWVSARRTTREEDIAYCLMGLFEINMPLLYGEGTKAFIRLQEEIIRHNNDHTIFCWSWDPYIPFENTPIPLWRGCLAPRPIEFRNSNDFVPIGWSENVQDFQLSNSGLRISLPLLNCVGYARDGLVMLDARYSENSIYYNGDKYARVYLYLGLAGSHLAGSQFPSRLLNLPGKWAKSAVPLYLAHERNNDSKNLFHVLTRGSVHDRFRFREERQYAILPIFSPDDQTAAWKSIYDWGLGPDTCGAVMALESFGQGRPWCTRKMMKTPAGNKVQVEFIARIGQSRSSPWEVTVGTRHVLDEHNGPNPDEGPVIIQNATLSETYEFTLSGHYEFTLVRPILIDFSGLLGTIE